MKLPGSIFAAVAILAAGIFSVAGQSTNVVASAPVYVPDTSHQNDPLPDSAVAFDAILKSVAAVEGQDFAHFAFNFTNKTGEQLTILDVHPSCGCTTADLPSRPWLIPAGTGGVIKLNVNLAGKRGTVFKTATVITDKGQRQLTLRIDLTPPPPVQLTDEQKMAGITAAKADRMAIFKGDCASCHMKNIAGTYGQVLYQNACAICHDAPNRATMVPNLAALKVATSVEFWRAWITFGKPGSLMPSWAKSQGGPLDDIQIASLAQYLNAVYPSKVAPVPQ